MADPLTSIAIGAGYGLMGVGAVISLWEAQSWVVERCGRRVGALLCLAGRKLRRKSITLKSERIEFPPLFPKLFFKVKVANDHQNKPANCDNTSRPLKQGVHNVVSFRKSKRTTE